VIGITFVDWRAEGLLERSILENEKLLEEEMDALEGGSWTCSGFEGSGLGSGGGKYGKILED
jgi:hypothetical protein